MGSPGHNPTGEGEWLVSPSETARRPQSTKTRHDKSRLPNGKQGSTSPSRSRSPFSLGSTYDEEESDDDTTGGNGGKKKDKGRVLPPDARDLVVEDQEAVEDARARERRKGEPQTKAPAHVYVHRHTAQQQRIVDPQKALPDPADECANRVRERQTKETGVQVEGPSKKEDTPVEVEEVFSPALPEDRRASQTLQGDTEAIDHVQGIQVAKNGPQEAATASQSSNAHLDEENNPWA